jgi:hypothetical protein
MNAIPTLREVFVARSADGQEPPFAALSRYLGGIEWHGLHEHVFDVLDVSVLDILLAGWKKHAEVRAQLRATLSDPSRTALVHLATHRLESTHTPSIQVRSQGIVMATLSFSIQVAFEVDAVELTIRCGEIQVVRPGQVAVRGTVKAESTPILERKLAPLRLPGRITVGGLEPAHDDEDVDGVFPGSLEHVAGTRAIVVG